MWISLVEKPVEIVEKFEFSTGKSGLSPKEAGKNPE